MENAKPHNIEDYSDPRTGDLLRESIARQNAAMTPEQIAEVNKIAAEEIANGNWMWDCCK